MRQLPAPFTAAVHGRSPLALRLVRSLQLVTLLLVAGFVLSTLGFRREPGFDPWLDGWLQGGAYTACALLLVLRPAMSSVDRRLWWLIAAGLACRSAAFVGYLAVVRRLDPQPYPSLADVGWVAAYVLFALALLGLARSRFERVSAVLVLDAVIAVCAASTVALSVIPGVLQRVNPAGTPDAAIVFNTLYPLLDVGLLLLTLGILLVFHWRPPPAVWLFAAGAMLMAAQDVAYLYVLSQGAWRPGTPLSSLSMLSAALLAFSPWAPRGKPLVRRDVIPGLAVPAVLTLCCLAVLLVAATDPGDVPAGALVLSVVGVLAAVARTGVSFANVRRTASEERRAARQGLMERLVQAQDAERERIAADVHDDSIQALAAVDLRLAALRRRLRDRAPDEVHGIDDVIETVHEAAVRLRSLLFELEPPALDADLAEALDDAAAHIFSETSTRWAVHGQAPPALPAGVRASAYRIAREALVNVRKHADASTVDVSIHADHAGVRVDVLDDGVGIAATVRSDTGRRHSGVISMRDRAVASGGWWRLSAGSGGAGTLVSFYLPLTPSAARDDDLRRLVPADDHPAHGLGRARHRHDELPVDAPAHQ